MLAKYNITEEEFEHAEMTWDDLIYIYNDFKENHYCKYQDILSDFVQEYLQDIDKKGLHSIRTRVKDPEHLIVKVIRKRIEKYNKYKTLTKYNYTRFLTDLIGIRCFILFKEQWVDFHQYITSKIENNSDLYIRDFEIDFDENDEHVYMAEQPKVHIRNGDKRTIYEHVEPAIHVDSGKTYRSIHYIIKYQGVYIEIQVRTLFEEGWGEVDHAVVYPYHQDDPVLKEYTGLLNRLTGLADEMGSFFKIIKRLELSQSIQEEIQENEEEGNKKKDEISNIGQQRLENTKEGLTPDDCLNSVMME